jgi:F-type H+-transporting ATPase subunit b
MRFSRPRRLSALRQAIRLGLFLFLAAAPAFAQESEPSADSPTSWVFRWLNFAIVIALIAWGFSKAAPYFRKHAEEISERIAEGTRAREAAEQKRREAQAKIAGIETEVAAIRAEAKESTKAEAERLKVMAKAEAEAIERAAQAEIAAAERAARLELKALAAKIAVERAEAVLRKELTPQAESALFRTFVTQLARSAN